MPSDPSTSERAARRAWVRCSGILDHPRCSTQHACDECVNHIVEMERQAALEGACERVEMLWNRIPDGETGTIDAILAAVKGES